MLYKEYSNVAFMRLHFLASQKRCADQFTVSKLTEYAMLSLVSTTMIYAITSKGLGEEQLNKC